MKSIRHIIACICCLVFSTQGLANTCKQTIYLTFDTGNHAHAHWIAQVLKKHQIKATFFLANERTTQGDYTLDDSWREFWQDLVDQGHAFGTHTFDHVYFMAGSSGIMRVKPQFGRHAGRVQDWDAQQYCAELNRVNERFQALTQRPLDALWRAPGGRVNADVIDATKQCGYQHIGWAPAGFSGDELPSEQFSNAALLKNSLHHLKDGDVIMAHLGIWSRKTPWAPAVLEPLIKGLKQKGSCFKTLTQHPLYKVDGSGEALFTK